MDGPASLIWLTLVVDHRTNLAALLADDKDITDPQRTAPNQNGRHRAASLVQLRLDHTALCGAIGVGLEFQQLGLEQDLLDQRIEAGLLERGYLHILHLAAHFLDHTSCSSRRSRTRWGFAVSGLSTLLIATIIGTPAALV
jgi:hypothetical protein